MRKPMEIYLSGLEWVKTHDNMGGVMGNLIFKDNMSYEKYRELFETTYFTLCDKSYITNLEQENERLKKIRNEAICYNKELCKIYDCGMELSNAQTNLCILEYTETLNILQNGSDNDV